MAYTFAAMPAASNATAQSIVNAITSIQDAVNSLDARVAAVEAALASTITSPDGSVKYIEVNTAAINDTRTGLPATHILMDRG